MCSKAYIATTSGQPKFGQKNLLIRMSTPSRESAGTPTNISRLGQMEYGLASSTKANPKSKLQKGYLGCFPRPP